MQSYGGRDTVPRKSRVFCSKCGQMIEIVKMRSHLRDVHQVNAQEVETGYLEARIQARRAVRSHRR